MIRLGFDIGSNSVGSAWVDTATGQLITGTSIFPAGVDESDEKRGDPKNAKRRMTRRTRITLARRSQRKRELRLKLIEVGLLPVDPDTFKALLDRTDPWELRRKGLDHALTPHEFGRVLLHLAQRRGALGLNIPDEPEDGESAADAEDGKVKAAIGEVRAKMRERNARTFGEFMAMVRAERVTPITSEDRRPISKRKGPRLYRGAIRNKAASYEHCADRAMIRAEFAALWDAQRACNPEMSRVLTDDLRTVLDDESGDSVWRHRGLLFGQRRQSWDLGTLGRCVLEPTERCAPHADMYASRYRVVETVNNLKIIERGREPRPLTPEERAKIKDYLSGPLGMEKPTKKRPDPRPKTTVSVTDLRNLMEWGRSSPTAQYRFNIENDEDREINTDWFSREIIHGAVTPATWRSMPESIREGLNRAILRHDPDQDGDAEKLRQGVMSWAGLSESQANALVEAWKRRPRLDSKRLNISRRAVRNLLALMDRDEPWPDPHRPGQNRWLTQIEARKLIAEDADFRDVTTGLPPDEHARRRYATGARGSTARDRYYMAKHILMKDGKPVIGPDGRPLAEPPPAPLVSNPVVRKAIHEVRRHIVEYMMTFNRRPDEVSIELMREARMGAKDADRLLFRNRLRSRIRKNIVEEFNLGGLTSTQQRAAVDRVVLCMQQGGASAICPLCGKHDGLTPRNAAHGNGCEVAHIIPRASGGHNGLGNLVLAHTKCNREMARRTPRQYWNETVSGGFEEAISWVEKIYGNIERPTLKGNKDVKGDGLWSCYFTKRDDTAKIEQFKKDIKDIQDMTARQDAATKYAARQVMAYISDAIFDGKGLPERSTAAGAPDGDRTIFATDGLWTSRFRREWGLYFDPHSKRAKELSESEKHERQEKDRGDHRHHAIDAIVIALCDRRMQVKWERREKEADQAGVNTADEEQMENYRRQHPLQPPEPYRTRDEFRDAVRRAVYGDTDVARPICHRPVKRKLIGALHEETLFGPVLDASGNPTSSYTARKSVLALTPNHLRVPEGWDELSVQLDDPNVAESRRREIRRRLIELSRNDPPPGKSGIVRDRTLRDRLRKCLRSAGLDPDGFTANEIKKAVDAKHLQHLSGVPIRSVVLLRTMTDPVVIDRKRPDHATGRMIRDDAPASRRAYVGGNNHHIEIRVSRDKKKREVWTGVIVSAFDAAQRKLEKLRAFRQTGIPKPTAFRALSQPERDRLSPILRSIELAHPIVDRRDDDSKGGCFVMSLCEGEMLFMKHKERDELGYFVVAKLDKPNRIIVVPHWDARAAGERKDAEGNKVPDSKRESIALTPSDLLTLAPPCYPTRSGKPPTRPGGSPWPDAPPHALKVRVSALGVVTVLDRD